MPKISIIVPVYKVEQYINRCVKSILNSTFSDFELILVDDGSPDKCPIICDSWRSVDDRIKVVHQKNMGLSGARNTGIQLAEGDYLTFVDSDDWVSPYLLEVLYDAIMEYNGDIAFCGMRRAVDEDFGDYVTPIGKNVVVYTQKEFLEIMLRIKENRCVHYAWGKLYRKNTIDIREHYPVGMLNEDVEGTFKAVVKSQKIIEVDYFGYYYYKNASSITGTKFGKNYLNLVDVWERIETIANDETPQYLDWVKYNKKRTYFTILCDMIIHGDAQSDLRYSREERKLLYALKRNCIFLLKSPMFLDRKLFMLLILINYSLTRDVTRWIYKKLL